MYFGKLREIFTKRTSSLFQVFRREGEGVGVKIACARLSDSIVGTH